MDVHEKLHDLMSQRGWTAYRLARECGLSEATIANVIRRNANPSLPTLEAICRTPLLYEPGTRTIYSDVDYMLLGFIVEKLTGERLDTYAKIAEQGESAGCDIFWEELI